MKKNMGTIAKGLGIGMAVCGTAAALGSTMMSTSTKRHAKKTAGKAMKAVGDIVDNISFMMK